jgi:hypothetical protein
MLLLLPERPQGVSLTLDVKTSTFPNNMVDSSSPYSARRDFLRLKFWNFLSTILNYDTFLLFVVPASSPFRNQIGRRNDFIRQAEKKLLSFANPGMRNFAEVMYAMITMDTLWAYRRKMSLCPQKPAEMPCVWRISNRLTNIRETLRKFSADTIHGDRNHVDV